MTEVTTQEVTELPWGPSSIKLLCPLPLTVEESGSGRFTLYSDCFHISGSGESFDDALAGFSLALEEIVDSVCLQDDKHLTDMRARALYESVLDFIPDNHIPT